METTTLLKGKGKEKEKEKEEERKKTEEQLRNDLFVIYLCYR